MFIEGWLSSRSDLKMAAKKIFHLRTKNQNPLLTSSLNRVIAVTGFHRCYMHKQTNKQRQALDFTLIALVLRWIDCVSDITDLFAYEICLFHYLFVLFRLRASLLLKLMTGVCLQTSFKSSRRAETWFHVSVRPFLTLHHIPDTADIQNRFQFRIVLKNSRTFIFCFTVERNRFYL
jgi:hypothetical protein